MVLSEGGSVILVIEDCQKEKYSMEESDFGSKMEEREVQLEKTSPAIVVIDGGNVMLIREEQ